MSDDGGTGSTDSGTANSVGSGSGDSTDVQTVLADAVAETDTVDALKEQLSKLTAETDKWRTLARKHEGRAKENAEAATKAKTVEQQLDELRKALSERDVADVERNGRLAMTSVKAKLAGQGFSEADVAGLLELIDPVSLLAEGEPDDKAIEKLTTSLVKVAGRTTPDRDQGKSGGQPQQLTMNDIIRRKAGMNA